MNYSIKVIFLKQNQKDKKGALYLRVIQNRHQKRKSLGIKLTHAQWYRYFDESKNEFKENNAYPMHFEHNNLIKKEIEKVKFTLHLPKTSSDTTPTFIEFWQRQINFTEKHGTRIKQQTVLNKLKKFLAYKNIDVLPFHKITSDFIEELQHYLRSAKDPRLLSRDAQNQYLKMIRSVLTKSKKKHIHTYLVDPFEAITFNKVQPKEKVVLDKEELLRIASTKFCDPDLRTARNIFLFQVFSNGMRIGDVIGLRWKNVVENSIKYEMMKNGKELTCPLNYNLSKIILYTLHKHKLFHEVMTEETIAIHDKYGFKEYLKTAPNHKIRLEFRKTEQINDEYFRTKLLVWQSFVWHKVSTYMNNYYSSLGLFKEGMISQAATTEIINNRDIIKYHGFQIHSDNKELIEIIDILEKFNSRAEKKLKATALNEAQKQKENEFVFDVLNFEDFKTLNNWHNITESQYKQISHKTIVINRRLKLIQKECKISKNLTTHVARHTFANLLLQMDNVNTSDISETLGHSSLAITDKYIKGGFNKNKHNDINNRLSNDIKL